MNQPAARSVLSPSEAEELMALIDRARETTREATAQWYRHGMTSGSPATRTAAAEDYAAYQAVYEWVAQRTPGKR